MVVAVLGACLVNPGECPPAAEIYAAPQETIVEEVTLDIEPKSEPQKQPRIVTMNVSAYTATSDECGKGDGVTASGVEGTPFLTCAADDLPFGTRLRINGQIWIVQDRFGGGYADRVDLMMETKDQCFDWGRQYIEVEILED